jgi:hypothetical protein
LVIPEKNTANLAVPLAPPLDVTVGSKGRAILESEKA